MDFQTLIMRLTSYWGKQGCVLTQPHDVEVGAGTFAPATFFGSLGPAPWKVGYVQPARRPADGRYGKNPNRLYQHLQFQVIMKPPPLDIQEVWGRSTAR